jgi:hypothetical protein
MTETDGERDDKHGRRPRCPKVGKGFASSDMTKFMLKDAARGCGVVGDGMHRRAPNSRQGRIEQRGVVGDGTHRTAANSKRTCERRNDLEDRALNHFGTF